MAAMLDGQELARRMPTLYGDSSPRGIIQTSGKISATLLFSSGREITSFASSADLLGIVVRGADRHSQWHDNRQVHAGRLDPGQVNIVPAGTTPRSVGTGVGVLHFYLPHAELRRWAARMGQRGGNRDVELISPLFASDPAIVAIGRCFAEVLQAETLADELYRDSLFEVLIARVLQRWSNAGRLAEVARSGGLAPWQVNRACEVMTARLSGDLCLRAVSDAVGLSQSHFGRAFKRATGLTPSRWLAIKRTERSKELLSDARIPLAEVALAAGYAAQAAFTTAFRRETGFNPGAWRRQKLR